MNEPRGGERWALCLSEAEASSAARLRQIAGVEVLAQAPLVWLRGPLRDDVTEVVHAMPAGVRYRLLADGQLVPWGARVPQGRLPTGDWQPLAGWFEPALPVSGWHAPHPTPVAVQLVRDACEREPTLLVTDLSTWLRYGETAPQVRLDCWQFAVDAQGRVLVRGAPLPPLAGVRLVEQAGIVVPAGWWWSPPVDGAVLRSLLALEAEQLALLRQDGAWERISSGDFVRATRSAIRHTWQAHRGVLVQPGSGP